MALNKTKGSNLKIFLVIIFVFIVLAIYSIVNATNRKYETKQYINDVVNIMNIFDSQFAKIKNVEPKKTNLDSADTLIFINTLMKETAKCKTEKTCLFWDKSPFNAQLQSEFVLDSKNKTKNFYLTFDFNEKFKSYDIAEKRLLVIRTQKQDSANISHSSKKKYSGEHIYYIAKSSNIYEKVDYSECKNDKCVFVASYQTTE